MSSGTIVRFDEIKGYGFVTPDGGGEDLFIHINDLLFDKRLVQIGARVSFVAEDGDRGLKASRVSLVDDAVPGETRTTLMDHAPAWEALSRGELKAAVTDALLENVPSLTGEQILRVREQILRLAQEHSWVE